MEHQVTKLLVSLQEHQVVQNQQNLYQMIKQNFKFGITASKGKDIKSIEPFLTYSFDQTSALNLKYSYKDLDTLQERVTLLSWFWYY